MTKPITSFIIILISLAFAFFYVKPEYDLVMERRSDIVSLDETLKNSNNIQTLINQTSQSLNSINEADASRFAVFLPETIDGIRFANNIQHIGQVNGIFVENMKITAPLEIKASGQNGSSANHGLVQGVVGTFSLESKMQPILADASAPTKVALLSQKKYATTKASFSFDATYESLQLFLNDLEKSLTLFNITSLTLLPLFDNSVDVKKTKGVPSLIYKYTVELETYSLK